MKRFLISFVVLLLTTIAANSQNASWIQLEAHSNLRAAQERTRAYANSFETVNGFSMSGGWYAVALGPFTTQEAEERRRTLRRENLIPNDSFIVDGRGYRQQFWPIGANTLNAQPIGITQTTITQTQSTRPVAEIDETPKQARKSEALLSRDEKKMLQIALQWEGFYNAAIDGSFGRGTRGSMAAYQQSMGYKATGILTSKQRAELLKNYNAILEGIGLKTVMDDAAGIQIDMPLAMVNFSNYEPPFVQYNSKNDSGARVLLISQTGDQASLFGLYDIMQTLEIVPLEGTRKRKDRSFVLTGQNDKIRSYTYAVLKSGIIKGFTLVWPAGDDKRFERVVATMKASFTPVGNTALDPNLGEPTADQRIDLLAGLEIRQPIISRTGFYIDGSGRVLTTSSAVQECGRISIDDTYNAKIETLNNDLGIAVLKPVDRLSPLAFATFSIKPPRLNSEIAVAGYSYEGALGSATTTFGKLSDIRGLRGEKELRRLAMVTQSGDAGGPVFDMTGAVLGMLLPRASDSAQQLPEEVNFAVGADAIAEAGISLPASEASGALAPIELSAKAVDMTVLVRCWN